jgi:hypothetical protein
MRLESVYPQCKPISHSGEMPAWRTLPFPVILSAVETSFAFGEARSVRNDKESFA